MANSLNLNSAHDVVLITRIQKIMVSIVASADELRYYHIEVGALGTTLLKQHFEWTR